MEPPMMDNHPIFCCLRHARFSPLFVLPVRLQDVFRLEMLEAVGIVLVGVRIYETEILEVISSPSFRDVAFFCSTKEAYPHMVPVVCQLVDDNQDILEDVVPPADVEEIENAEILIGKSGKVDMAVEVVYQNLLAD